MVNTESCLSPTHGTSPPHPHLRVGSHSPVFLLAPSISEQRQKIKGCVPVAPCFSAILRGLGEPFEARGC